MNEQTFFMVYLEGSGTPTYKHTSKESANAEAERLCRQTGIKKAYILRAVERVEKTPEYNKTVLHESTAAHQNTYHVPEF